jgi:hypothetical protein
LIGENKFRQCVDSRNVNARFVMVGVVTPSVA